MTEGIFVDVKMIKFGATPDEIYTFLKEVIAKLDEADKRMPKAIEKANEAIDEYLMNTTVNEEVETLLKRTYEEAKKSVEDDIVSAKKLINYIAYWYNGDVESAELWVFTKSNEVLALVVKAEIELEFLENIVDNVKKMMEEAKVKSEKMKVEYIEGNTCVAGVATMIEKPYPEIEDKYDL